jgi:peptidoglycan hydrolase-like protein with peptidoglycan-binding domain
MATWIRAVEGRITDSFDGHRNRKVNPSRNPGTDYGVPLVHLSRQSPTELSLAFIPTFTGSGGRMIFQSFPSGHNADYLHLSRIDVVAGQQVKQGQIIGLTGGSGLGKENGYGPHLHLSVRFGGRPTMGAGNLDFEKLLAEQGVTPAKPAAPAKPAKPSSGKRPYPGRWLRRGEPAGPDVLYLQAKLGVNPPGPFGPLTHKAVVAFQRKHKLLADGIVGPLTWSKLG